jgi:hypothetical protein
MSTNRAEAIRAAQALSDALDALNRSDVAELVTQRDGLAYHGTYRAWRQTLVWLYGEGPADRIINVVFDSGRDDVLTCARIAADMWVTEANDAMTHAAQLEAAHELDYCRVVTDRDREVWENTWHDLDASTRDADREVKLADRFFAAVTRDEAERRAAV